MSAFLSRSREGSVALCAVAASYSDGEVAREIGDQIREPASLGHVEGSGSPGQQIWSRVIRDIHALMLRHGDTDEYRKRYDWEAVQWYRASCELTALHAACGVVELIHVGAILVFSERPASAGMSLISPIHNMQEELAAGTIEDSCLSPFSSRSASEIASQLLWDCSPKVIAEFAGMDRGEFLSKIGHAPTRMIGYFPSDDPLRPGEYRRKFPIPTHRIVIGDGQGGDLVSLYIPTTQDMIPYSRDKLLQHVRDLRLARTTPIVSDLAVGETMDVQPGALISIEIAPDGSWGRVLT